MSLEQLTTYLDKLGEREQAQSLLLTLGKHAWQFEEYDDLAKCFFKMKDYTNAIKYGELTKATAYTNERMWVARSNLINTYNHSNFPEKAMTLIKANERVIPDDSDTRLEKAFSHFLLNEKDKAEAILVKELERTDLSEETRTKILFNLGTYHLYRDEFQKGLSMFLHEGQKLDYWRKSKLPFKFWDGGIMPGKTIILYAEAGIGDEIINVRFMKHLTDYGMNPIWLTDRKDLCAIFNRNGFRAVTNLKDIDVPMEDLLWTYPMSLPVYINVDYTNLWYGPYLESLCEYDKKWDVMNQDKTIPKIGIRWQGNPAYDHDLHRSVPLKDISVVMPDDMFYYSLQRDTGLEELVDWDHQIVDMSNEMVTIMDTMSIINNLDIVITSCTSIAHMAASMGKRTFIFVPISAYYTWSHSGNQSPWYGDNVTLLRQVKPRSWVEPIQQLNEYIDNY